LLWYAGLSGGGAVYHDLGNLNFSFTETGKDSSLSDFENLQNPLLMSSGNWVLMQKFEGKNDLMIEGKKIFGQRCTYS
jgi:lipoate-protein ligase A